MIDLTFYRIIPRIGYLCEYIGSWYKLPTGIVGQFVIDAQYQFAQFDQVDRIDIMIIVHIGSYHFVCRRK